ncbi:uncharacterized protein FN964_001931 [Alca torda]
MSAFLFEQPKGGEAVGREAQGACAEGTGTAQPRARGGSRQGGMRARRRRRCSLARRSTVGGGARVPRARGPWAGKGGRSGGGGRWLRLGVAAGLTARRRRQQRWGGKAEACTERRAAGNAAVPVRGRAAGRGRTPPAVRPPRFPEGASGPPAALSEGNGADGPPVTAAGPAPPSGGRALRSAGLRSLLGGDGGLRGSPRSGCPGRFCGLRPWRASKAGWTRPRAAGCPAGAGGLEKLASRGPFQTLPLYDPVWPGKERPPSPTAEVQGVPVCVLTRAMYKVARSTRKE